MRGHFSIYGSYVQPAARGPHAAQLRVLCTVQPSLVFAVVKVSCILITCPYFNNLEFDIFDAGGPQCDFIMSVTFAVRIRTLSVY